MKFTWSSSAFSCSATAGAIYATGHVEHVPGSASDSLEWNWRVRGAVNGSPRKGFFSAGAAPTELAARTEVEKAITTFVAKFSEAA